MRPLSPVPRFLSGARRRVGVILAVVAGATYAAQVIGASAGEPVRCPCSFWDSRSVPATADSGEPEPVELGVRFTSAVDGVIPGIRFYKGANNTGVHVGNLWTATGRLLASATFTNETESGWQQAMFGSPVPVTAGTRYVASYFAPHGHFSVDRPYFIAPFVRGPLTALAFSNGGNGVFTYGSASAFPRYAFDNSNYWVDVIYVPAGPIDTTSPTVTLTSPAQDTLVPTTSTVLVEFSEPMLASSVTTATVQLRTASNQLVPGTVSYDPTTRVARLTPQMALAAGARYTAEVIGGAAGAKDLAGNALSPVSWTFTTEARAEPFRRP